MSYSKSRVISDYTPLVRWTWGDASEPDKTARSRSAKSPAREHVRRDSNAEYGKFPSFSPIVEGPNIYEASQQDAPAALKKTTTPATRHDSKSFPRIPSLEEYLAILEARTDKSAERRRGSMRSVSILLDEVNDLLSKALSQPASSYRPKPYSEDESQPPSYFYSDASTNTTDSPGSTRSPSPSNFSYPPHLLSTGFYYEEDYEFVKVPLAECPDYDD